MICPEVVRRGVVGVWLEWRWRVQLLTIGLVLSPTTEPPADEEADEEADEI